MNCFSSRSTRTARALPSRGRLCHAKSFPRTRYAGRLSETSSASGRPSASVLTVSQSAMRGSLVRRSLFQEAGLLGPLVRDEEPAVRTLEAAIAFGGAFDRLCAELLLAMRTSDQEGRLAHLQPS